MLQMHATPSTSKITKNASRKQMSGVYYIQSGREVLQMSHGASFAWPYHVIPRRAKRIQRTKNSSRKKHEFSYTSNGQKVLKMSHGAQNGHTVLLLLKMQRWA